MRARPDETVAADRRRGASAPTFRSSCPAARRLVSAAARRSIRSRTCRGTGSSFSFPASVCRPARRTRWYTDDSDARAVAGAAGGAARPDGSGASRAARDTTWKGRSRPTTPRLTEKAGALRSVRRAPRRCRAAARRSSACSNRRRKQSAHVRRQGGRVGRRFDPHARPGPAGRARSTFCTAAVGPLQRVWFYTESGIRSPESALDRFNGAWPSGKARDFGSRIRRFESFRPNQLAAPER